MEIPQLSQKQNKMENIKLIQGDCLEKMKDIQDKSVDMILCDLPYGTTACSWDEIIPLDKLWEEYNRIIKDNGAVVLFGSEPFTSALIMSNPRMFREELIWLKNKSGSGLQANQKHIKIHEQVLVFSKNGKYTYNPQKWLVEEKNFLTQRKTFTKYGMKNNIYGSMENVRKADDGSRNPISVLSCKVPHNPSKTKEYNYFENDIRLHPTQKPVALCEYLIKTYTNEGDLVLDNTMGSGTTGVGCINTNRKFIGIELDEKYFEIAKERIESSFKSRGTKE